MCNCCELIMCAAGGASAAVGRRRRPSKDPRGELPEAQAAQQSEEAMTLRCCCWCSGRLLSNALGDCGGCMPSCLSFPMTPHTLLKRLASQQYVQHAAVAVDSPVVYAYGSEHAFGSPLTCNKYISISF